MDELCPFCAAITMASCQNQPRCSGVKEPKCSGCHGSLQRNMAADPIMSILDYPLGKLSLMWNTQAFPWKIIYIYAGFSASMLICRRVNNGAN